MSKENDGSDEIREVVPGQPERQKKGPKKEVGVSKAEFTAFQEKVDGTMTSILELLQTKASTPEAVEAKKSIDEGRSDDITPVPPGWVKAVHEILGEDFSCTLSQPDGGGTLFKIVVPWTKSNVTVMEKEMKPMGDIRSREIGNTGLAGVKEWCLKVRANLLKSGKKLIQYP